jgi:Pyruvate/2-oxoacid:ferredoxin oxidoreductase delta subunit
MIKFIVRFPFIKNSKVFLLNTRAGLKMSKIFIPGISGLAQFFPAAILRAKGYKIVGMQPLDLPSNWISLHPGVKEKVNISIHKRCKRIAERFSIKVLSGKKVYRALISTPIDLAVSPISIGYYFIGRFAIAKTFYASDKCTNCGRCIEQCPVKAIKLVNNSPFWSYNCESCMRCMNNCPERAIETSHGYFALMWYLAASFVVPFVLFKMMGGHIFGLSKHSVLNEILLTLIDWSLWLVVIIIGYEILHRLLRIKLINKIIKYTSLTSYKFWRRYKSLKTID